MYEHFFCVILPLYFVKPATAFKSVVFPLPLSPSMQVILPSSTERLKFSYTAVSEYFFVRFAISITGVLLSAPTVGYAHNLRKGDVGQNSDKHDN